MAERELVVVLFRGGVPVMAACAKCQRKFFTPDTYPLRDSIAAHEYLADKFDRHECETKDDQKRKRQPFALNESKPRWTPNSPICPLCGQPCSLENCVTDAEGRAVHKDCYRSALISGQEQL
jgi:hypothetical protein